MTTKQKKLKAAQAFRNAAWAVYIDAKNAYNASKDVCDIAKTSSCDACWDSAYKAALAKANKEKP